MAREFQDDYRSIDATTFAYFHVFNSSLSDEQAAVMKDKRNKARCDCGLALANMCRTD